MIDLLDPTIAPERDHIDYAPRPEELKRLRIGLIDNTRKNSEAVLRRLAEKLETAYGMKLEVLIHKHQRAPLKGEQLNEFKGKVDFVIAGVGD